jgi:glycosyltransferase involved in cell wall biosynthesis
MKVSVFSACFNSAETLDKALNSVLMQTYKNIEIVITDDGSTDNSFNLIKRIASKDKRVIVYRHKKNKGAIAAFKNSLKHLTGDLIIGLACDDKLIHQEFFSTAVKLFKNNIKTSGVFAKTNVVDAKTNKLLWTMGSAEKEGFIQSADAKKQFFKNSFFVPGSSFLMNHEYYKETGGYDFRLGPQVDYFINHALPMKYGIIFLNSEVSELGKSEKSYSARANNIEFFRRHALFQKKIDLYLGSAKPTCEDWKEWRSSLINSRLGIEANLKIYNRLNEIFNNINEWEKDSLAPYIKEISQIFQRDGKLFRSWIKKQEDQAHAIFIKALNPATGTIFEQKAVYKTGMVKKTLMRLKAFFTKPPFL